MYAAVLTILSTEPEDEIQADYPINLNNIETAHLGHGLAAESDATEKMWLSATGRQLRTQHVEDTSRLSTELTPYIAFPIKN
jgi:hypothetical protein